VAAILGRAACCFCTGPFAASAGIRRLGNAAFDAELRATDAAWGLRDLEAVAECAAAAGFELAEVVDMPANNMSVVLRKRVRKLPQQLRRSLTWDRGKEMADRKNFTIATNVQVYFCDPRSPWQRGSNKNTNGLLRQYFPRGTDLSRFSQAHLNRIALRLNQRPRKTLGFETPAAKLQAVLH
jgi:hypothetical protein